MNDPTEIWCNMYPRIMRVVRSTRNNLHSTVIVT